MLLACKAAVRFRHEKFFVWARLQSHRSVRVGCCIRPRAHFKLHREIYVLMWHITWCTPPEKSAIIVSGLFCTVDSSCAFPATSASQFWIYQWENNNYLHSWRNNNRCINIKIRKCRQITGGRSLKLSEQVWGKEMEKLEGQISLHFIFLCRLATHVQHPVLSCYCVSPLIFRVKKYQPQRLVILPVGAPTASLGPFMVGLWLKTL